MRWRFYSRFSSYVIPTYLILLQMLIFWQLILKFRYFVICSFLGRKIWFLFCYYLYLFVLGLSQWHIKKSLLLVCQLIYLSEPFVNSKVVPIPRYTNIVNITVDVDFLTTNSKIEMFCYLLLPWSKKCDFCFAGIWTFLFGLSHWHINESLWFICQLIFFRELFVQRKLVPFA